MKLRLVHDRPRRRKEHKEDNTVCMADVHLQGKSSAKRPPDLHTSNTVPPFISVMRLEKPIAMRYVQS